MPVTEVVPALNDEQHHGLTSGQAAQRLATDGPNALPRPPRRTSWRIVVEITDEPMFRLMAAAVAIYLVLGDLTEAAVLLAFLLVIVTITLVQQRRTERVLEALRDMTSPRALVWRDGLRQRIPGTEVVTGDLLELTEGDRVPADAQLVTANDLLVDESLLTGESLPVMRSAPAANAANAEASMVYAGTMVVAGQASARVTATGAASQIGRIGKVLGAIAPEVTPLHQQTRQLVRWFTTLGLMVSVLVSLLYWWTQGGWLAAALAGITMAMSMLPEEFPLVLTVFMAMGAWRMSQHRVLTRRPAAIEALGAATVLCTDKTGTLTHNRMQIARLVTFDGPAAALWAPTQPMPPAGLQLLHAGVLASEQSPFDPMERALHDLAGQHQAVVSDRWALVHEYGLSPALPMMSHVWRREPDEPNRVAAKGAPERLVPLCRLPAPQQAIVLAQASHLADQGMRVLAVALADWQGDHWPEAQTDFTWTLMGLVALADPLRDNVPKAVSECQRAGVRVVMITGDHPGTALAIARQAGINGINGMDRNTVVVRGDQVAAASDDQLRRLVAGASVFARVAPTQKLRIVQAFKANGDVVAMTGDGVNDAPALSAAHIGIAMGGRGTDVARESASLVLLDDDFGTLVQAVRLGRRIYDNLRRAMRFVLAVHVPIAGLTLLPMLFGWPLLFTPMHIAFLEIAIDPVCSIVFEAEPEEADLMARPPRDPAAPLFTPLAIVAALLQGLLVLAPVAALYGWLLRDGVPAGQARAGAFIALVLSNLMLILALRSPRSGHRALSASGNRSLSISLLVTGMMLAAVVGLPALRGLFGFEWPSSAVLLAAAGTTAVVAALLALHQRAGG